MLSAAALWPDLRGLVRGVHMAASFSLFGTCYMVAFLLPGARIRGLAWLAWGSFLVLFAAGIAWFGLEAADMSGAQSLSDLTSALPVVAGQTRFGILLTGRLIAAAAAIFLFQTGLRKLATLAAAGAVIAEAWLDHGGAMTGIIGHILLASAILHLACGSAWLGSLPALRLALKQLPLAEAASTSARFSPIGIACVAGLIGSAITQYIFLIGSPAALLTTAYGLTASFKILLLAALITLAAINRQRLTPGLANGLESSRRKILNSVSAEIVLGLAILLAAGLLLQLAPPTMAAMLGPQG